MRKRLDRHWRGDRTAWQAALLPLLRPGRAEAAVSVGGIVAMSTMLKIAIAAGAACVTAFLLW